MSKISYQIDYVNISADTDNKLVTVMPTGAGANTLNININNKAPLVINRKDLEPTDNPNVLELDSDVAASNGLNSLTIDYSDASLFSGPTISYNNQLGSITFSEAVDEAQALGDAKADETENVLLYGVISVRGCYIMSFLQNQESSKTDKNLFF